MLTSHAQNFEDVILWRALKDVENGFYIDIGAQDPIKDSISLAFYEKGWRGVHVEPLPQYAESLRRHRPDETVIEAVVGQHEGSLTLFAFDDTGLSTAVASIAERHSESGLSPREIVVDQIPLSSILDSHGGRDVHWLKIDVEGMEADVIDSWGASPMRPWVVLVESTAPSSDEPSHQRWEPKLLSYGYTFAYSDGLNRFYVSDQHQDLLKHFGPGPNIFDGFVLAEESYYVIPLHDALERERERSGMLEDVITQRDRDINRLNRIITGMRNSKSWRMTRIFRSAGFRSRKALLSLMQHTRSKRRVEED